jgi:hypothetical protein
MDLMHEASVISPAGDDELLPGHVVPSRPGGSRPPATALGGHLEVARPVWVPSGAR